MKILVFVKRTIDHTVRVRVKPDGSGVQIQGVKMAMNPFDAIALEEAVRLKESGKAEEILVATLGDRTCDETLRTALAMGADRAIRIDCQQIDAPYARAQCFKELVIAENVNLVLMGKQAIDDDAAQTPQMLAALLGWGQGTCASKIEIESNYVRVEREIDGGRQTLKLALPAVVSADLRLNEPRFPALPNIMKAKAKPLAVLSLDDLNLSEDQLGSKVSVLRVEAPPARKRGEVVEDVETLITKLTQEAGVL